MATSASKLIVPLNISFGKPNSNINWGCQFQNYRLSANSKRIVCAKRSKRTGSLRYPSEKKSIKVRKQERIVVENKFEGVWRLSMLEVSVHEDPGKDFVGISDPLLQVMAKVLKFPVASLLPREAFKVIRKSFDARKVVPKFVYTVDIDVTELLNKEPRTLDFISSLEPKVGLIEHILPHMSSGDLRSIIQSCVRKEETAASVQGSLNDPNGNSHKFPSTTKQKVAVVGSGPSGLFAALVLAEFGVDVTLIERGQPVEQRGRDIGALVVRRMLQEESNFCFGEGGAGTWSDGKLVTRIGKNSSTVVAVLKTLVDFGAPQNILVYGKPHLGTDRLIPLLKNFRQYLQESGVTIMFGKRVDDLIVEGKSVVGVKVSESTASKFGSIGKKLDCDAVVLAVGHSARDTYEMLLTHNVDLVQKDFAVGLRVEHPQSLVNSIQYAGLANEVKNGRGKVPVADYKVAEYVDPNFGQESLDSEALPGRSCYSFCMCPGGQVVLTSTDPSELCINGMSFSRRSSRWANAALVVSVSTKDFDALGYHGPFAGVEFQRNLERKASIMGGGKFVVPVQTVTNFLDNKISVQDIPESSYRLGVKAANLHELFPSYITETLQKSILKFEKELPGFISKDAILHGVETRTSSPVKIRRDSESYESTSHEGFYPVGEGAGYAGGIVSAAVDGVHAGFALAKRLGLYDGNLDHVLGKSHSSGFLKY